MIRVCDHRFKNNRETPNFKKFGNKSKAMAQNDMYLGCTPTQDAKENIKFVIINTY